MDRDDTGSS